MPWRNPLNRAHHYRARAEECRTKAEAAENEEARRSLLQTAETWERMAAWEDKHYPNAPSK